MSCFVDDDAVLAPELLGLVIASVKGCEEFVSAIDTFSPLAFDEGLSTLTTFLGGIVSDITLESFPDSKLIFCEKLESTEFAFGGDCDR